MVGWAMPDAGPVFSKHRCFFYFGVMALSLLDGFTYPAVGLKLVAV